MARNKKDRFDYEPIEETKEKVKVEIKSYPWDVVGRFNSFPEADKARNSILEESDTLQAKVRRLSKDYVVKTRLHPELRPKNNKKNRKKGKKRKSNEPKIQD